VLAVGCLLVQVIGRFHWRLPTGRAVALAFLWTGIWLIARLAIGASFHVWSGATHDTALSGNLLGQCGLGIAGAIQEELIFRGMALGALVLVVRAAHIPDVVGLSLAAIISAVFFALAHTNVVNHHDGAELVKFFPLLERTAAGVLYAYIFLRQGLAVGALTHAAYNVAFVCGVPKLLDDAIGMLR
jgi:membrane protease YdiL (CAAX protease family)